MFQKFVKSTTTIAARGLQVRSETSAKHSCGTLELAANDTVIALRYEGRFGKGRTVDDMVRWVETIPPMPENASRALKLVDDPGFTPFNIAAILASDPALVSRCCAPPVLPAWVARKWFPRLEEARSGRRLWFAKNPAVGLHT